MSWYTAILTRLCGFLDNAAAPANRQFISVHDMDAPPVHARKWGKHTHSECGGLLQGGSGSPSAREDTSGLDHKHVGYAFGTDYLHDCSLPLVTKGVVAAGPKQPLATPAGQAEILGVTDFSLPPDASVKDMKKMCVSHPR